MTVTTDNTQTFEAVFTEDLTDIKLCHAWQEGARVQGIMLGGRTSIGDMRTASKVAALTNLAEEIAYKYDNFRLVYEVAGKVEIEITVKSSEQ